MPSNWLKPDNRRETGKAFLTWDIETLPGTGDNIQVRGIGCYNIHRDKYYYFDSFDDFWPFIVKNHGYIFYGHNAGKFDNLFLLRALTKKKDSGIPISIIFSGSRIVIAKIQVKQYKNKRVYASFWDSYAILPKKLEKLLKTYGLESHKDVDYERFTDNEYWETVGKPYLKQDCISLAKIIYEFHSIIYKLGGKIRPTLASTSMALYKVRYLDRNIWRNQKHNIELRETYIGGRTEVLNRYAEDIFSYDVNSLYPYVMKENIYPVGHARIVKGKLIDIDETSYTSFVLAKVGVKQDVYLPVLPYKDRQSKKVIFPTGEFYGYFSYQELKYAMQQNQLDFIHPIKQFIFPSRDIFSEFVDDIYEMRRKAERGLYKLILKLLMNSLY